MYRLNVDVDIRNKTMLNSIAAVDSQYRIEACDSIAGQTNHIDLKQISKKRSETGGLHDVFEIAVSARVMLTANVDVSDGRVNPFTGTSAILCMCVIAVNGRVRNFAHQLQPSNTCNTTAKILEV